MKAVVVEQYDTIDNIALKDVALPDVAAGQVRVKVQAASIGFVDGLKVPFGRPGCSSSRNSSSGWPNS